MGDAVSIDGSKNDNDISTPYDAYDVDAVALGAGVGLVVGPAVGVDVVGLAVVIDTAVGDAVSMSSSMLRYSLSFSAAI